MTTRKHEVPEALLASLMADYKKPEDLIGENGLLKQLTKLLVERALDAEMAVLGACMRTGRMRCKSVATRSYLDIVRRHMWNEGIPLLYIYVVIDLNADTERASVALQRNATARVSAGCRIACNQISIRRFV